MGDIDPTEWFPSDDAAPDATVPERERPEVRDIQMAPSTVISVSRQPLVISHPSGDLLTIFPGHEDGYRGRHLHTAQHPSVLLDRLDPQHVFHQLGKMGGGE